MQVALVASVAPTLAALAAWWKLSKVHGVVNGRLSETLQKLADSLEKVGQLESEIRGLRRELTKKKR